MDFSQLNDTVLESASLLARMESSDIQMKYIKALTSYNKAFGEAQAYGESFSDILEMILEAIREMMSNFSLFQKNTEEEKKTISKVAQNAKDTKAYFERVLTNNKDSLTKVDLNNNDAKALANLEPRIKGALEYLAAYYNTSEDFNAQGEFSVGDIYQLFLASGINKENVNQGLMLWALGADYQADFELLFDVEDSEDGANNSEYARQKQVLQILTDIMVFCVCSSVTVVLDENENAERDAVESTNNAINNNNTFSKDGTNAEKVVGDNSSKGESYSVDDIIRMAYGENITQTNNQASQPTEPANDPTELKNSGGHKDKYADTLKLVDTYVKNLDNVNFVWDSEKLNNMRNASNSTYRQLMGFLSEKENSKSFNYNDIRALGTYHPAINKHITRLKAMISMIDKKIKTMVSSKGNLNTSTKKSVEVTKVNIETQAGKNTTNRVNVTNNDAQIQNVFEKALGQINMLMELGVRITEATKALGKFMDKSKAVVANINKGSSSNGFADEIGNRMSKALNQGSSGIKTKGDTFTGMKQEQVEKDKTPDPNAKNSFQKLNEQKNTYAKNTAINDQNKRNAQKAESFIMDDVLSMFGYSEDQTNIKYNTNANETERKNVTERVNKQLRDNQQQIKDNMQVIYKTNNGNGAKATRNTVTSENNGNKAYSNNIENITASWMSIISSCNAISKSLMTANGNNIRVFTELNKVPSPEQLVSTDKTLASGGVSAVSVKNNAKAFEITEEDFHKSEAVLNTITDELKNMTIDDSTDEKIIKAYTAGIKYRQTLANGDIYKNSKLTEKLVKKIDKLEDSINKTINRKDFPKDRAKKISDYLKSAEFKNKLKINNYEHVQEKSNTNQDNAQK